MLHLFTGTNPISMTTYPYEPVFKDALEWKASQLGLDLPSDCKVTLTPSISAYVGGDIVSGIVNLGIDNKSS